jgi:hypothetical protein
MNYSPHARLKPEPLPAKISEWERAIESGLTLNDHVEQVHVMLYDESPEYRAFLEAVYDEDAVEGSLSADNYKAAELLREKARKIGNPCGGKKLSPLAKSLNVVLRRYRKSRLERRDTVGGTRVTPTQTHNQGNDN